MFTPSCQSYSLLFLKLLGDGGFFLLFSTFSLSPLVRRQEVRLDGIGEVIRVGVEIDEGV